MTKSKVAIIGSGNIGTDLMIKIMRTSENLEVAAMIGIDPDSDGLARAKRLGIPVTHEGVDGLLAMPNFTDIEIVLDATSARAHIANAAALAPHVCESVVWLTHKVADCPGAAAWAECTIAEVQQRVRHSALAHLVVEAGGDDVVAFANRAVGVYEVLRHDE